MLKILERNIESVDDRLILLAPRAVVPSSLENVISDSDQHYELLREVQLLLLPQFFELACHVVRVVIFLYHAKILASRLTVVAG